MKTSELIAFLQKSLVENGDLEVGTYEPEVVCFYPIDTPVIVDEKMCEDLEFDSELDFPFVHIGFEI